MFSKKTYRTTRWIERVIDNACYSMDPDLQFTVQPQLHENWHIVRNDVCVNLLQPLRAKSISVAFIRAKNGKCQCMVDGAIITVSEDGISVQQKDVA